MNCARDREGSIKRPRKPADTISRRLARTRDHSRNLETTCHPPRGAPPPRDGDLPMSRNESLPRDERGWALAMSLLVVVILSLLALVLFQSINVETRGSGFAVGESQALNSAEAGVSEAIERIRSGDVPDSLNPKMVTQIYLAAPGTVPVLGTDSTGLATSQPAGSWLNYSSATRG